MKESPQEIQLALSRGDVRLFRMQCGAYRGLHSDDVITVGVPGMSDLIGFSTRRITEADVGKLAAIYTAIEVKSVTGRTSKDRLERQRAFIGMVRDMGGIADFARGVGEAKRIIQSW